MIFSTAMLVEQLREYSDPAGKFLRMKKDGSLIPLTRGIYETNPNTPGYCLAGMIYGPSYLSFDFALAQSGLIPETVYAFTSATCLKKKAKEYLNHFGRFTYRDVPLEVYPFGILIREENGYVYQIASPEKALCDKLYTMPPVTSRKEIEKMLFEDLRIDHDAFAELNKDDLQQIGDLYHCSNLKYLMKYLRRAA